MSGPALRVVGASGTLKLVRSLGQGGFCSVYLAELVPERGLARRVAVKMLRRSHADSEELRSRLLDEAWLLSQIEVDGVVRSFGADRYCGEDVILLEYVDGLTAIALRAAWQRRVRAPGLPARTAIGIAQRVAETLDAARHAIAPHTRKPLGLVHGDIKASNIMVTPTGAVKLIDFGSARADVPRSWPDDGAYFGTRPFMAPERLRGAPPSARSDVYALAATLWTLATGARLTGLPPQQADHTAALGRHIERLNRATRCPSLGDVVRGALDHDPTARPSMASLATRLDELEANSPGVGLRTFARRIVGQQEPRRAPLDSYCS